MVLFNYSTKEITAKIVYYGPGLCGKTTNLQFIYENLPKSINKGKMLSLATKTDRTLFFDFLPIDLGTIRGMRTRLQLYTVPGQVFYNTTRKLVLKGADGIVFVADSQKRMIDANFESFKNLEQNLTEHGMNLSEIPLIIQFNKRDLPEVATLEELNTALNKLNVPIYEAVATTGIGVHETLKAMTRLVLNSLKERYAEKRAHRSVNAPRPAVKPQTDPGQVAAGTAGSVTSPGPMTVPSVAGQAVGMAIEPQDSPAVAVGSMTATNRPAAMPGPAAQPGTTVAQETAESPEPRTDDDAILLDLDEEPVLELVDESLEEILEEDGLLEIDEEDTLAAADDVDLFADNSGPGTADGPEAFETTVRVPRSGIPAGRGSRAEDSASLFADMESEGASFPFADPFAGIEPEEPASHFTDPFAGIEPEEPASPFADMEPEESASPFARMEPAAAEEEPIPEPALSGEPARPEQAKPVPLSPAASAGTLAGGASARVESGCERERPADTAIPNRPTTGCQEIMLPIDLAIGDKTISFQLKISLDIAPGGELQVARIEGAR